MRAVIYKHSIVNEEKEIKPGNLFLTKAALYL